MFAGQYYEVQDRNNERSGYEVVNVRTNTVVVRIASLNAANKEAQYLNLLIEHDVYAGIRNADGTFRANR